MLLCSHLHADVGTSSLLGMLWGTSGSSLHTHLSSPLTTNHLPVLAGETPVCSSTMERCYGVAICG